MKNILTSVAILLIANVFGQTIDIGPNEYAFRYSLNNNFGLFFNTADVQYEFRDGFANPVLGINANNGDFTTNLRFANGSDYLVRNNAYAFRSAANSNYGLYFNGTNPSYDFRNGLQNAIFSISASTGSLTSSGYLLPGNTTQTVDGAIRYNGSDLEGYVNNEWTSLTAMGSSGGGSLQDAYDGGSTIVANNGSISVEGTDGLNVSGVVNSGEAINYGLAGASRFYFSPRKASIRAGWVNNGNWYNANVGTYSAAFGDNTIASGPWSMAVGTETQANGAGAFTFGANNTAGGTAPYSFVGGALSHTTMPYGFAFGLNVSSEGFAAIGFGRDNVATADYSFSAGQNNESTGFYAISFGENNSATGDHSFAIGFNNTATDESATAFG